MQSKHHRFTARVVLAMFSIVVFSAYSTVALAWGSNGHTTVGTLAVRQLNAEALSELETIMGSLDQQAISEACNWPDEVRETDEWSWSYPLHYINIPRGDFEYLESRDCPQQHCATEAIKRYAGELGEPGASKEKRWQAFAWLCHLTGDLHQPLHAGFADDRGGNDFEVVFRGEQTNLHSLWDSALIARHAKNSAELTQIVSDIPASEISENWSPEMVNRWTNESHELAKQRVYPASKMIDENYERQNWPLIQRRMSTAASRLALILNSVLKEREVEK